jgi:hypothetical protein
MGIKWGRTGKGQNGKGRNGKTPLTRTSEISLILNFLNTEISVVQGNPQMLPQIRINDVEAKRCLKVTAIICPMNLRLIIIGLCRLGTCVRSIYLSGVRHSVTTATLPNHLGDLLEGFPPLQKSELPVLWRDNRGDMQNTLKKRPY